MLWATLAFIGSISEGVDPILSTSELVSAIIPTLNRPELLQKAVLSALHQSHTPIEVIVVIDGEDRATENCLACMDDPRLRVISLAVNVGGSEARNIGVRAARGRWIAFLDDDDEWLPSKIELQLAAAGASETAFPVISSRLIVRTPTLDFIRPVRKFEPSSPVSEQLFCRRVFEDSQYTMQTSTLFMRRETMLAIPFRSSLKKHQDWDWLLRASCHPGVSFHAIPEPLTILRVEDSRPSIGRSLDWKHSLQWGQEMRRYFTSRAYSFFVATECISRAVKSRAGPGVYARLVHEFVVRGSPTPRSLVWLAGLLCIPELWRKHLRALTRRRSKCAAANTINLNKTKVKPFGKPVNSNITL